MGNSHILVDDDLACARTNVGKGASCDVIRSVLGQLDPRQQFLV
jgi:hypothetical protein